MDKKASNNFLRPTKFIIFFIQMLTVVIKTSRTWIVPSIGGEKKKSMKVFFYFYFQCHIHNIIASTTSFATSNLAKANTLAFPRLSAVNIAYQACT